MIIGILVGIVGAIILIFLLSLIPGRKTKEHKSFEEKMSRYWQKSLENQANYNETMCDINEAAQEIVQELKEMNDLARGE